MAFILSVGVVGVVSSTYKQQRKRIYGCNASWYSYTNKMRCANQKFPLSVLNVRNHNETQNERKRKKGKQVKSNNSNSNKAFKAFIPD